MFEMHFTSFRSALFVVATGFVSL